MSGSERGFGATMVLKPLSKPLAITVVCERRDGTRFDWLTDEVTLDSTLNMARMWPDFYRPIEIIRHSKKFHGHAR